MVLLLTSLSFSEYAPMCLQLCCIIISMYLAELQYLVYCDTYVYISVGTS